MTETKARRVFEEKIAKERERMEAIARALRLVGNGEESAPGGDAYSRGFSDGMREAAERLAWHESWLDVVLCGEEPPV